MAKYNTVLITYVYNMKIICLYKYYSKI